MIKLHGIDLTVSVSTADFAEIITIRIKELEGSIRGIELKHAEDNAKLLQILQDLRFTSRKF